VKGHHPSLLILEKIQKIPFFFKIHKKMCFPQETHPENRSMAGIAALKPSGFQILKCMG